METLVLSHAYLPVARVGWQRAITLWFLDKVEVLETYEDRVVRSTSVAIPVPAVIRFLHRTRVGRRGVKLSRENLFSRDKGRCQYCNRRLTRPEATWDHVIPRSLGGKTRWDNIVLACLACNQRKGGCTPEDAGMRLLSTPRAPRALPTTFHFTYSEGERMPASWRQYLFDLSYWHGSLEES